MRGRTGGELACRQLTWAPQRCFRPQAKVIKLQQVRKQQLTWAPLRCYKPQAKAIKLPAEAGKGAH